MRSIWIIARRELRALFDQPTGYVLLIIFVVVNGFLFFRQAYVSGVASLRPMLDLLPWMFLFFVPAVAMRSLAEDLRSGLLEIVLSQPISELELVLGKYLGTTLFLWFGLALTLPIPLGLTVGAQLPWGPVVAQYVGSMLLAAGLAGVGVWASALARSQITAFIVGLAVMFVLVLVGLNPLVVGLPPQLGLIAARLGVLSHFDSIGRGVIDLRDAVYFVSLAAAFLLLAYSSLMARKLAPGQGPIRRLKTTVVLLVGILVVVNLLGGYLSWRLDLTPGRAYTLSKATRDLAGSLSDLLTIKVFASAELPSEAALLKRDVDDLLSDVKAAGKGKIRVIERDPAQDAVAHKDAVSLGIQAVQFNVVGKSELQVKEGYLGIAIQYADGVQAIPFVSQTEDLEYRVASAIQSLTRTKKPVIGLVEVADQSGAGNRSFRTLQLELSKTFEVRNFPLSDSTQPAADVRALVLAGSPDSLGSAALARLQAYFDRGGGALVMASGMALNARAPMAAPRPVAWDPLLKRFGVSVRSDMIYDFQANQVVPMPTNFGQVLQAYPLWLRARAYAGSVVTEGLSEVFLPWTSSIDTSGAHPGTIHPLLISSKSAGRAEGEVDLTPGRQMAQFELKTQLLGVMVSPTEKDSLRGRLIVVGNSDVAADRYAERSPENLSFALNSVDWLAQDEALIAIRGRDRRPPRLLFSNPGVQAAVKYANLILWPGMIGLFGLLRLVRRRRLATQAYHPQAAVAAEAV
jgi:ABC-type uncharacterized transport system involved in gliding motility auxiliary subunit